MGAFAAASDALAPRSTCSGPSPRNDGRPSEPSKFALALHSGEARLHDKNNYSGPAIIRCARLRSIAHGGQTVLSDAARDLVVDRLPSGVTLRNLGPHRLKDLARPERVWQLCHSDIETETPPVDSLDAWPNNLPAQLTPFLGRGAEMSALREHLAHHRLTTLTGAGGCGKTRLALQLAAEVAECHPGGTWWVELAGVTDPELVTATVASAMNVRAEPERPLVGTLAESLAGPPVLVVLDNCEQVLTATARLSDELLRSAANVSVLATSRETLGITGELAWRVPSLDHDTGVQLFIDRAALVRPGFMPTDEEMSFVSRICERLDGLPLAIELAASRTRVMRPGAIAARSRIDSAC